MAKKPTQKQDIETVERAYKLITEKGLAVGLLETEWVYEGEWIGQVPHYHFEGYGLVDLLEKLFGEKVRDA